MLTVWRLKHPLSFPAPVVAFPRRVEIWIVFSTPFRADYREPAFQWPPCFMVVSGTSHQRDRIGGVRISCVLYLCKPLFQPNTKGEAWLNPFYFLVCVCEQPRPRIFLYTHVSGSVFMCVGPLACLWMWLLVCLDPPFSLPLSPSVRCQQHVQSRERPGIGLGAVVGGSNRAISQVPVQPTIPQGVSVNAEAHGVSAEEQGCLSKCIQCEGSC